MFVEKLASPSSFVRSPNPPPRFAVLGSGCGARREEGQAIVGRGQIDRDDRLLTRPNQLGRLAERRAEDDRLAVYGIRIRGRIRFAHIVPVNAELTLPIGRQDVVEGVFGRLDVSLFVPQGDDIHKHPGVFLLLQCGRSEVL